MVDGPTLGVYSLVQMSSNTECTCKSVGMHMKMHTFSPCVSSFSHTYRCSVIRGLAGFAGFCAFPFSWIVSILVCVSVFGSVSCVSVCDLLVEL